MRKITALIIAVLLFLTGCAAQEEPAEPVELDVLRIELPMPDDHTALANALSDLPDALHTALISAGAEVDAVSISVGTSTEATCTALTDSGIDAAFLTASNFIRYGDGLSAILADGTAEQAGTQCKICAADSEYGNTLLDMDTLSWDDWDQAVWGITSGLSGRSGADLYLSDNCGSTTRSLTNVAVYDSQEELEAAAAAGEVDVYTAPEADKKCILGETEPLFSWVAAVSSERTDLLTSNLADTLSRAVTAVLEEHPDWAAIFGADSYTPVEDSALDTNRRLS